MSDRTTLAPGRTVGGGRFILLQELGRGGMGVVWRAQDTSLGEQVALKFLPPEVAADPVAVHDLRRETARCHRLTHPHIVRIHDFHAQPDGAAFLSMELVEGPTLSQMRLGQPDQVFPWERMAPLVPQLCAALAHAHDEGVVHRDLKPANVMLDRRGRVKLADFGVAAVVCDFVSRVSARSSTGGTLAYMSPQQLEGRRPSAADDIYALGATLYELLTSRPPFYAGDITHQVLRVPATPIAERLLEFGLDNAVPAHVAALIMACLAKEPEQRPPSAQAVAAWVAAPPVQVSGSGDNSEAASDFGSVEPETSDAVPPAARLRALAAWRWWGPLALAVFLAGGVGVHQVIRRTRPATGAAPEKPPPHVQAASPNRVPRGGVIAYWPLDGNAQDESGGNHDGEILGAIPATDRFGRANRAYAFDGQWAFIRVPHSPELDLTGDFTIALWFSQSEPGVHVLLDKKTSLAGTANHDGWRIDFGTAGENRFRYAGGTPLCSVQSPTPHTLGTRHQLAVTSRNKHVTLYLDGTAVGSGTYGSNPGNRLDLHLGRAHPTTALPQTFTFHGTLDDIRILAHALSAAEVRALHQRDVSASDAGDAPSAGAGRRP